MKLSLKRILENPNGVFMKMYIFLAFDSTYEENDFDAGSKLDK